jgi:hypothetical protein
MGYALKTVRRISHALTSELKRVHLVICLQLLPKLGTHAQNNCRNLVTGDERWFHYEYGQHRMKTLWQLRKGPLFWQQSATQCDGTLPSGLAHLLKHAE